jgi:ribosomal protein S18 acetylase RimI-like enzyme
MAAKARDATGVCRITDRAEIRAILETDRRWAIYALGDLAPGFFDHSEWCRAPGQELALVLLYRAFQTPVFFALGGPEPIGAILTELTEPEMYLSIRPEILPLVKARYQVHYETAMWRMTLDPANFSPAPGEGVTRLGPHDLAALQRLYADGKPAGEVPDFFSPSMIEPGVFYGIWEAGNLVAAAGTHLVAPSEGVGAVGNVYTRRDLRNRGLGGRVTGAVAAELLRMGLRTVALNVSQRNTAALGVYERLGFARYCAFYEGLAVRRDQVTAAG